MQLKEFENMVLPFKNKMYRLALRIVGSSHEAEDVVQEVMIKVWKKRDHLESVKNMEAWCMTLTRNEAIDATRSKHRRTVGMETQFDMQDQGASAQRQMESSETVNRIKGYISALPENYRTVVHLRDIEEMSYDEIAEVSGFTKDQVKVYLHRGRKKLREQILNLK
ncbi:RNA polymerase sigma factor [Portibacter lacus]|uniref:DNA-directed RNA polymerase sigma-70 factor n=1 Tax=Portibacter lacus TaxID=1099794 RepID=A0AA37SKS5_9BACT|nr:sigma-70 family RNA polymerase sigma factor [Portibacter lacus]GLR16358.1 DNA-directed RNA polymerase sigma-70 factor [Portibacter lacus]